MLTELSLAQLNVAYNRAVVEHKLPLKEIKGFKDKPIGIARLGRLMAEHGLTLEGMYLVKPDGLAGLNADMAGLAALGQPAKTNVVAFKAKAAKPTPKAKVGKVKVTTTKPLNKRGPAPTFADHQVITVLVAANPKKPKSMAHKRFALYADGMTVGAAMAAGLRRDDFKWDVAHGHISIS